MPILPHFSITTRSSNGAIFNSYFVPTCVALLCLCLSGCGATASKEELPTELKPKSSTTSPSNRSEDMIFNEAIRQYALGLWGTAHEQFDTLLQNYPNSAYQEFAELKIADCEFENSEFGAAATHYEEFAKSHPGSQAVAYALLRAGRSSHLMAKGTGRDSSPLEKARGLYAQVLTKHQHSSYANSASQWQIQVIEELAAYEKMVADFYNKQELAQAEQARQATYSNKWQPLLNQSKAEQAKINEQRNALLASQQTKVALNLQPNTLTPQVLKAARTLVPASLPSSNLTKASQKVNLSDKGVSSNLTIERVECKPGMAILSFQQPLPLELDGQIIQAKSGLVELSVLKLSSKARSFDCHGYKDLRLPGDGRIVLDSTSAVTIMTLHNPERLLLVSTKTESSDT